MSPPQTSSQDRTAAQASVFCRQAIFWWLPLLYLLISSCFYLHTYDSAQVKITLLQMGGMCLLGLWLCRIVEDGWRTSFSKQDLACLAPFLAFLGSGIFSFIHAPYHWSSLDFFLRRIFYMTIALVLIEEFDGKAVERLIRVLIWTAWIAAGYGVLQWFDFHFFPPGVGNGVDPFLWRGAFGDRLFSTYGNPNFFADYLVIMFPILASQFFKTRRPSLLVLLALDVLNIYGSQTKGAWIGLGLSGVLLAGTYFACFQWEKLVRHQVLILTTMFTILLLAVAGVVWKLRSSFASINFRLFTWEATWEMIETQPLLGTGIGSFWVIYPAFRRPPIFHIEGKHNTETDHVEDEYLEVLFDEGILGFGIFLWLILSTFVAAYRALGQATGSLKSGERAPPRAYDLMGFLVALQGMLAHNFFDVSMRFVSSGVYLGLLSGIVVNLSRGAALSDLSSRAGRASDPGAPEGAAGPGRAWGAPLLWLLRLAASIGGVAFFVFLVIRFGDLQMPVDRVLESMSRNAPGAGGEFLQWAMAWVCLLYCAGRLAYYFLRAVWASRSLLAPVVVLAMLLPLKLFWGFFEADIYHNLAIAYSRAQQWDQALKRYKLVGELNPAYIMSFYFSGNVFTDRFNMVKFYNADWGDTNNVPRDDFERALAAFEQVRARSPNYVQVLNQLGNLHMRRGEWLLKQGRMAESQEEWDKALEYYRMYHNIDPVFPPNFYSMAQIYILRRQYDKAADVYRSLLEAKECRVDPKLLRNDWLRETLLSYQSYVWREGRWLHLHESPKTYSDLGASYWMLGNFASAERAFHDALSLDPNFGPAKQNLEKLYRGVRIKNQGTPSVLAPPSIAPAPSIQLFPR